MKRRRQLTPFGLRVKKRLLDLGITQKEFCREHQIPESRFSEMLSGKKTGLRYQRRVAQLLGISDGWQDESRF